MVPEEAEIERSETGLRILLTLVFLLIARVVETVVVAVVVFELAYALVTRTPPSERVRRFANRAVAYFYRLGRYLTYNEAQPPFPFADFPREIEPPESLEEKEERGAG
jgi:hypothetical protein